MISEVSPLEYRRRELGLTQAELAKRLGVSIMTISRYERGKTSLNSIALDRLTGIARALNWPLETLLAQIED